MNRVHVFVRCYVDHQMAPARAALVTSCAAHVALPYVAPLINAHNVNDLERHDYSVDAAVAVPGNRQ